MRTSIKARRPMGTRARAAALQRARMLVRGARIRVARNAMRARRRRKSFYKSKKRKSSIPLVMYGRLLRQKIRTILTYCDTVTLQPGSGQAALWFRLNSIRDPDARVGIGHFPAFHNRWSALYSRYRVYAASWTLVFVPRRNEHFTAHFHALGTNAGESEYVSDSTHFDQHRFPAILGWEINNQQTNRYLQAGDSNILREVGSISPKNHAYVQTRYGKNTYVLRGFTSIRRVLHDSDDQDDSYAFGTDPSNVAYMAVCALSKDGAVTNDWTVDVKIKYHCVLSGVSEENQNN